MNCDGVRIVEHLTYIYKFIMYKNIHLAYKNTSDPNYKALWLWHVDKMGAIFCLLANIVQIYHSNFDLIMIRLSTDYF